MPAALTKTAITAATRRAAESGKRIALTDPGHAGLQMRITPKGVRSWVLYCFVNGKPRRFMLGRYPGFGLAQARKAAGALREQVRGGADPIAEAREKRAKAQAAQDGVSTLAALLDLFERQRGRELKSWPEYRRRIESVFAAHLKTPLALLTLSELQMRADSWPAQQSAAAAVRYLRPVLKWAAAAGRAYVARELTEITPPATVRRRQRVLSRGELAAILPKLKARGDAYGAAFRFLLLTLARREELGRARWRDIDLQKATWLIPQTKSGAPHTVPLSRQALALLRAIRPESVAREALVFATATGGALANWDRETKKIWTASKTDGWHRHDLRRTGATLLGELGCEPHIVEAGLNHRHLGSQLASLYNQARYRPQVTAALQRLADELDTIAAGKGSKGKVVSITFG